MLLDHLKFAILLILNEIIILILLVFINISVTTSNWIILGITLCISIILTYILLIRKQREIIFLLNTITALYLFFQVKSIVEGSIFTITLTEITVRLIDFFIRYESYILLIFLIILNLFFHIEKVRNSKLVSKLFIAHVMSLITVLLLIIVNISKVEVVLINTRTFEFVGFVGISRITIIESCSGIYSILIFSITFLLFSDLTRKKYCLNKSNMIILGFLGGIGSYVLNLIRIIFLIYLGIYISPIFMSEIHIYLGTIFIITYLVLYWSIIWYSLSLNNQKSELQYNNKISR